MIEIFTAGSYICRGVVEQVTKLACSKCEVLVYDLNNKNMIIEWERKAKAYQIQTIPTVIIDGEIMDLTKLKKTS